MPTQTELRKELTNQILKALDEGVVPWKHPWSLDPNCGRPTNAVTKNPYQGINVLLLMLHSHQFRSDGKFFGTYRQWQSLGGQVMARPEAVPKGQWGARVILFKPISKTKTNSNGEEVEDKFCFMKQFTVFNIDQVEGDFDQLRAGYCHNADPEISVHAVDELITNAEVDIFHNGNRAFYDPSIDAITMPNKHQFQATAYYETLLHELCHWAEHPDRLNWDRSEEGNSYAMGELVAEIGACFLCSELGVPLAEGLDSHVSYVGNWAKKLHDAVQTDPSFIMKASTQASKVCDYLLSFRTAQVREPAIIV